MPARTLWLAWSALALTHTVSAADGIIEGVVDDSTTGGPVYRATVTLFGADEERAVTSTDSDGVFWFRAAAPGRYEIAVEQAGYAPKVLYEGVELEPGETTRLVVKIDPLDPLGSIVGTVLNSDRKPVARAFIALRRKESRNRISIWKALSAKDGTFRFGGIPAGCYRAVVSHEGEAERGFRLADERTYRIDTHTLCVAPGQELRFDARLRPVSPSYVRGRADDDLNRMFDVRIHPRGVVEFPELLSAWTESPGGPDFSIRGLPPGRYSLLASDYGSEATAVHTVDTRTGPVDGVLLRFSPREIVEGVVHMDGDAPPPGLRVILMRADEEALWREPNRAPVSSAGAFRFDRVPPGLWRVEVEGLPAGAYVASVKFGGREEDDGLIEVGAGSKAKLEIETGSAAAAVEGRVTGGGEDPVALVNAYPLSGPSMRIRTVPVRRGRFRMALPPGRYRLMAFPIDDLVQASSPDAWKRHSPRLPAIDVERGMLVSQDVPLIEQ